MFSNLEEMRAIVSSIVYADVFEDFITKDEYYETMDCFDDWYGEAKEGDCFTYRGIRFVKGKEN